MLLDDMRTDLQLYPGRRVYTEDQREGDPPPSAESSPGDPEDLAAPPAAPPDSPDAATEKPGDEASLPSRQTLQHHSLSLRNFFLRHRPTKWGLIQPDLPSPSPRCDRAAATLLRRRRPQYQTPPWPLPRSLEPHHHQLPLRSRSGRV